MVEKFFSSFENLFGFCFNPKTSLDPNIFFTIYNLILTLTLSIRRQKTQAKLEFDTEDQALLFIGSFIKPLCYNANLYADI